VPAASGSGIAFARPLGVSFIAFLARVNATDLGHVFRLRFGSDQTPTPDGSDPVSYRSFGIEIKSRGTTHDWRIYAHNGTSISFSAWTNTGLPSDTGGSRIYASVISNGAGAVTGYLGINGNRSLSQLTISGGPTTGGTAAQSFIDVHVANSATGTTGLGAFVQDAMIYSL